jgi:hypothetical protein
MVVVTFRNYDKNNKLDMFNKQLAKVSKDRFELRQNKRGNYYLYDYDFREITTSKKEIKDIVECMQLEREFKELEV